MEKTVAVEEGLTPVKEMLQENGYQVVGLKTSLPVDAVVITGIDNNITNQQNIVFEVPVINANGRNAEEVVNELKSRMLH